MEADATLDQKDTEVLLNAYRLMCEARALADIYENNKGVCSKYVHATSKGHEAIQLATAFQLKEQDFVFPYYRDDSILLGIGYRPYELMLQLFAKKADPFSGGRTYYCHPSSIRENMPKIPHQSSATGMQAIPATGLAHGIQYLESQNLLDSEDGNAPVVICSLGDGSVTEGEVAEAFQMAVLKKLPIIYLVQDNEWDISAHSKEIRAMDADEYAKGFKGLRVRSIDGTDFPTCYEVMKETVAKVRFDRKPYMIHAKIPLLNHHTSGVRMEWYRSQEDIDAHFSRDPLPKLRNQLLEGGIDEKTLTGIEKDAEAAIKSDYDFALGNEDPQPEDLMTHIFAPTPVVEEKGIREPDGGEKVVMVDAALHAVDEIMKKHPESLLYGQDVGGELGGVFREAALLAKRYGDERVFNTPIQEAYIVGSTVGMSAAGARPIVEVQFADYIWPGLNQLFTEVSRSYYLTDGKWPVQCVIRVPIGAYGSGGPYHSTSIESVLLQIRGIKVVYPSNAADLKGLMKSAYYDPNPVVVLEHKGLYWSKVKGTEDAKTIEPDENYIIPIGKARIAQFADAENINNGDSLLIITYGMGVHWAKNSSKDVSAHVEILDLRSLNPIDIDMIMDRVKTHNKCLIITEEPIDHSFAQALAGKISSECFEQLDAPVDVIGSKTTPAIPLNEILEKTYLPNIDEVQSRIKTLLSY
ncbi:MAG: tungsten formylmethanofuran dehydrogenase [Chitinophagales bacterium]|nr:tungsten formylmethanofuran dehydrogenase [Chitinophagales bacterium]